MGRYNARTGTMHASWAPQVHSVLSKLTLPTKLAYWIGQLGEGLMNSTVGLFLLFYYNQVLGLSGTLCGIALFIAMAVDALTDPLAGSASDGWHSRWGRRHPFMYGSALPMGIGFFLLFFPPVLSELALFGWLLVFSILIRIAMTLYSVPHMALGAEMTNDYRQRTTLVAGRTAFGFLGTLTVFVLGFGWFFAASERFPNGQLNAAAYPQLAGALAVLMVASILGSAWGTHHLIPALSKPGASEARGVKRAALDVIPALRNPSFRWLILGFALLSAPVGVGTALTLYLNTFFWQISPERMTMILVAMPVGIVFGSVLAPLIGRYIEKKQAMLGGAIGWMTFATAPVCLHYAGLFSAPGTLAVAVALAGCGFMAGFVSAQAGVAVGSMLADVADEQELVTRKRQEGVFYGGYAFVLKATSGIGAAVAGIALDLIHWPVGAHVRTAADVPPEALFKLAMIGGPGLALGLIPALWCLNHYTLDRARHQSIVAALQRRSSQTVQ